MTAMVESILNEFREEVPATRRVLERIPADKLGWKPHPKSRSLGELAMHVANIHGMAERIVKFDEFSVGRSPQRRQTAWKRFDRHLRKTFSRPRNRSAT